MYKHAFTCDSMALSAYMTILRNQSANGLEFNHGRIRFVLIQCESNPENYLIYRKDGRKISWRRMKPAVQYVVYMHDGF